MKVLMVGSGGREHALIKKLLESDKVTEVICAPGNAGIACDAITVPVSATDIEGITELALKENPDFVFVAPDDPLAMGLVDRLEERGIRAFGPDSSAARIESSKVFAKDLMKKYGIPTADYQSFSSVDEAKSYIKNNNRYPVVIKADGLALGKGVVIAEDYSQAESSLDSIMTDKVFGESGNKVVIEEFLTGPEVSVLSFTDGKTIVPMISSMDHKRAFDGDKGLNTGGMGTIAPNPYYTPEIADECMKRIFIPTVEAMNKEGCPFKGCLYFGLMLTEDGPKVIEYNARFGDPETQVVLPLLETSLIDIVEAIIDERLSDIDVKFSNDACACIMLASGGYPSSYKKGYEINGLSDNGQIDGATVYHSGTTLKDGKFVSNGGRVLGFTAKDVDLRTALNIAYSVIEKVSFKDSFYRKDIGQKALQFFN